MSETANKKKGGPRVTTRQLKDEVEALLGRVRDLETQVREAEGWQHRVRDLERRLVELSQGGGAVAGVAEEPGTIAAQIETADGVLREDTHGPETVRASTSSHSDAVNKALSVLGLVPDQVDEKERTRTNENHKHALGKALEMFGIAKSEAAPPPPPIAADVKRFPQPVSPPERSQPFAKVPSDDTVLEAAPVPLPALASDTVARWEAEGDARDDADPVDLNTALPVNLKRRQWGAADVAVPILNGAVLVGAACAALYAAGATSPEAIGTGGGAALLGAIAMSLKSASLVVRAALGGLAVLLMHALALIVVGAQAFGVGPAAASYLATSLAGAWIVQSTRHPLAIFLGLTAALLLPAWFATPGSAALSAYAFAVNAGGACAALRLRRLQPSVLGALLTVPLLLAGEGATAALFGALHVLLYLGQALAAPFLHRRASYATFLLALAAFCLAGWTAHALYVGPPIVAAGGLFLVATMAALVAGRLPHYEDLLHGGVKAGAVILILSALPLGFDGTALAAICLSIALLLAVFARTMDDPHLRAAGALVLIVSVALLLRHGFSPALSFAAALVATVLYSVDARGPRPVAIMALLAAVAYGGLLHGLARALPAAVTAWAWAGLAVVLGAVGRFTGVTFARAGGAVAAGAAAVWALMVAPQSGWAMAAMAAATLPHVFFAWNRRGARELFALLATVLLFAAAQLAWAAPWSVLAVLAALPLWLCPVPAEWRTSLRSHARFLTLLVMARCLLPDVSAVEVAEPWVNLRFFAMAVAAVAGLCTVRFSRNGRVVAALLATATMAAAVLAETSDALPVGLAASLTAAAAFLLARRKDVAVVETVAADEADEIVVDDAPIEAPEAPATEEPVAS